MLKLDLKSGEPRWFKFPEKVKENEEQCSLLICPYPNSKGETTIRRTADEKIEMVLPGSKRKEAFMDCLLDQEDMVGDDDKPLRLDMMIKVQVGKNEKAQRELTLKEFIYDYQMETGIPRFVLEKAGVVAEETEEEEKN